MTKKEVQRVLMMKVVTNLGQVLDQDPVAKVGTGHAVSLDQGHLEINLVLDHGQEVGLEIPVIDLRVVLEANLVASLGHGPDQNLNPDLAHDLVVDQGILAQLDLKDPLGQVHLANLLVQKAPDGQPNLKVELVPRQANAQEALDLNQEAPDDQPNAQRVQALILVLQILQALDQILIKTFREIKCSKCYFLKNKNDQNLFYKKSMC